MHPRVWRNWHSRRSQKPLGATPCGFESHHPHQTENPARHERGFLRSDRRCPSLALVPGSGHQGQAFATVPISGRGAWFRARGAVPSGVLLLGHHLGHRPVRPGDGHHMVGLGKSHGSDGARRRALLAHLHHQPIPFQPDPGDGDAVPS